MQAGGNREEGGEIVQERGRGGERQSEERKRRWRFTASSRVFVHVCVPLTSEALTRPSWKEQLEGSWVHKLRYLHQWQRKALFTQDRHLHGHTHTKTHREGESVRKKATQSRRGSEFAKVGGSATEEMSSDPKWAPAVVVPLRLARSLIAAGAKFSLHIFSTTIY